MLEEPLRHWVHAHNLDAGVAVKCIGTAVNVLTYGVLKEPMDENYIASSELFTPAHFLLHHLAVMDDELKTKIAHRNQALHQR